MHGERRRGRSRSRVLYWFRTPPGVKVGRAALDPEAIQLIEAANPGLDFDWPRILKGETTPEPRGQIGPEEARGRPARGRADRPGGSWRPGKPEASRPPVAGAAAAAEPDPVEPEALMPQPVPDTAAGARLGSEGLGRLRARYAEVVARILEKVDDPAGQAELNARAERLNPDAWVTDDEVTTGLEQYEAVYESLRSVVGRRRKRTR